MAVDIDTIREFIQDTSDKNILLDYTEQFSDDLLDMMIPMVYSEISILYPSIKTPRNTVPDHVVIYGVLSKIFESESFVQLRNQVEYSDTNSSVGLSTKNADYTNKSEMMRAHFLRMLESIAASNFMNSAWGTGNSNASDFSYSSTTMGRNL